ncbi:RNA polymerase III subunit C53 [Megalopta genalis]|uniref:RNA polymerase III subunit C53 n=1 Tax=Megalopta genalis TaxID=115081 RepID=UPI003FD62406
MASEKNHSVNSNHTLPTNVKIKVEPGTSMPAPIRNIKIEPGLSTSTTRLTSFRLPRDLTLGGNIKTEKSKKVYTPNLNAQRTKKKDDAGPGDSAKPGRVRDSVRGRGRGGKNDRGRGRASNLIQSSGIWSTGINSTPGKRSSGGGGGGGYGDSDRSSQIALEKPKLDLNRTVDKAEEEEKLKLLLRDDFIDSGEPEDIDNGPITLPMLKAKLQKVEIKQEIGLGEEEVNTKPIISENGEVLPVKKEVKIKIPKPEVKPEEELDNISQMIDKTNSYILIQFPDCLPGFVGSAEDTRSTRPNASNQEKENGTTSDTDFCTLNSLKPGILGKLQILKSGKTRLVLGENNLIVDLGSRVSFRQDLIAAKVDTEKLTGDLINLGPVSNTLVCSPDWESMLA